MLSEEVDRLELVSRSSFVPLNEVCDTDGCHECVISFRARFLENNELPDVMVI